VLGYSLMTALPIPQPKTSGGRPPFDPPISTTFDSSPGDEGDPLHKVYADSVKQLLKSLDSAEPDQLAVILSLIQIRKKNIERELGFERMLGFDLMPPPLFNLYSLEAMLEENEVTRTYIGLLESLDHAEQRVLAKLRDLNIDPPASHL